MERVLLQTSTCVLDCRLLDAATAVGKSGRTWVRWVWSSKECQLEELSGSKLCNLLHKEAAEPSQPCRQFRLAAVCGAF